MSASSMSALRCPRAFISPLRLGGGARVRGLAQKSASTLEMVRGGLFSGPLRSGAVRCALPSELSWSPGKEHSGGFSPKSVAVMEDPAGLSPKCLVVVSFYKFADLPDYAEMRSPLREICEAHRVSGGIILSPEGINGSLCGTREALRTVFDYVESDSRFEGMRKTEAPATEEDEEVGDGHSEKSPLGAGDDAPFRWGHVRIKLKSEVVPLGIAGIRPSEKVGKYVKPKDWNALISDPETVTIDVRNDYEIRIGKFKGAVDPETQSFREFPAWVENRFDRADQRFQGNFARPIPETGDSSEPEIETSESATSRPKRIAMYCTGGIRCEKSTSYLLEKGFDEVYHLEGGILKYLEEVPAEESLWEGQCFVFDKRVSVGHGLKQGTYSLCYGCKKPVDDEDKQHPGYEEGVSCAYCYHSKTEDERARARARQRQSEKFGIIGGPDRGKRPDSNKQGVNELERKTSVSQESTICTESLLGNQVWGRLQ